MIVLDSNTQDLQAKLRKIAAIIARERNLYQELSTLVQRTVFQVLQKAEQDRRAGRASVYQTSLEALPTRLLYRICANSANDLLRRRRKERPAELNERQLPVERTPESLLLEEEEQKLLTRLLAALECYRAQPGLSEKQRAMRVRSVKAFTMVRLQGRSTKETSRILSTHRSLIRTDIARVENYLRRQLERAAEDVKAACE